MGRGIRKTAKTGIAAKLLPRKVLHLPPFFTSADSKGAGVVWSYIRCEVSILKTVSRGTFRLEFSNQGLTYLTSGLRSWL